MKKSCQSIVEAITAGREEKRKMTPAQARAGSQMKRLFFIDMTDIQYTTGFNPFGPVKNGEAPNTRPGTGLSSRY